MFDFFKRWKRRAILERPFPPEWDAIIAKNVALFQTLTNEEQAELRKLVACFIEEKPMEGAGGLEIDDEKRVTIAAQACFLLLHRDTDIYPKLDAIVVYPSAYKTTKRESLGSGVVIEGEQNRLGESWTQGVVVLAWDAVRAGTQTANDGRNVVLHEFAHQLDQEDGTADGAPDLDGDQRKGWAQVLGAEYEDLKEHVHVGERADIDRHKRSSSTIDEYGATNPAEFFAVVTELFFERGGELKRTHPELYEQFRSFYKQDPASRPPVRSRKERRAAH
jgi:Mlc titration factor MtfA (ptsG expression regulator)